MPFIEFTSDDYKLAKIDKNTENKFSKVWKYDIDYDKLRDNWTAWHGF